MDTPDVPAGSIVVGIDGSPWSDDALDWAIEQAALEQRTLTIVHAIMAMGTQAVGLYGSSGLDYGRLLNDARADAQALLSAAAAHAHERDPHLRVHDVLSVSDPRTVLLALGEHAAMVVVGSRGRGPVASLLLGSVSVSVSKHAPCPVVVRRGREAVRSEQRIVVGVDGTEVSLPAIEFAYRIASFRGCALSVLHCYSIAPPVAPARGGELLPDLEADRALVSESLAGMAEKFPDVEVTVQLVSGFADQQLLAPAPDVDLVVIGRRRTSLLADLVHDSVAPAVLEHALVAVAVVPAPALGPQLPTAV
ncbi:universal stress protein [Nocardioides psychrotolerans]|uniref:Nucleotide-binding universal stress protein, UspA family n=1 Tax=Nocardioides psychrotolerans TaxID=1005945 RepID=A0A1I3NHE3_9ACTN|nr:universal stress protein [Nocardioides psychrotolerans]GEP39451.1 universal stress protein [Nocardioides psychrotolerans]SFJ08612.1 Nucleotide-binding universal stress protein, UspA family [Nocardioides psychrotolerans]